MEESILRRVLDVLNGIGLLLVRKNRTKKADLNVFIVPIVEIVIQQYTLKLLLSEESIFRGDSHSLLKTKVLLSIMKLNVNKKNYCV